MFRQNPPPPPDDPARCREILAPLWAAAASIKETHDWYVGARIESALIEIELVWSDRIRVRRRLQHEYRIHNHASRAGADARHSEISMAKWRSERETSRQDHASACPVGQLAGISR